MRYILAILTFLSMLFYQVAVADQAIKPYTDPSKSIMLGKDNAEFTIKLAANPTTGYTWMAAHYNARLISVVGHQYQAPVSQIAGAGGIDTWTFRVNPEAFNAPHVLTIKMLYARPWNINDNNKETDFIVVTH